MRVAVIGAGATGLTAAYRLASAGHECDVYERWPGLGGQVASLDLGGGDRLEHYYHHLFTSDRDIVELYDELGMEGALEWRESSVAIFAAGRLYPFTSPLDLLRFKPMSVRSRLRTGLAVLLLQRGPYDPRPYEAVSARAWIERRMGSDAWETVWGPLLRGKFGDRAEEISMAWLWSKLAIRRQVKGRGVSRELLGYPRGGWEPLLRRLRAEIERRGGRVLVDRPAARIDAEGEGFAVVPAAPDSFRSGHDPRRFKRIERSESYDAVIATVPSDIFEQLLGEGLAARLADGYLERLRSIEYRAAVCLLLELDRPFSPFYWTNIADPTLPFVGLIEQTNLIEPARYGGRHLLYVANYVSREDELATLEAPQLLGRYESGLHRVNPEFSDAWVGRMWAFREPAAQPLVTVGYAGSIPAHDTGAPGLLLANTTQIYPEDRGTNYSVRLGGRVARMLLNQRAGSRQPS